MSGSRHRRGRRALRNSATFSQARSPVRLRGGRTRHATERRPGRAALICLTVALRRQRERDRVAVAERPLGVAAGVIDLHPAHPWELLQRRHDLVRDSERRPAADAPARGALPADVRYRPAWATWTVSWESIVFSCADDRPLANSQPPRAKTAAAAAANAIARRSRIGMAATCRRAGAAGYPMLLTVSMSWRPERAVDLAPQVVDVLVDRLSELGW